MLEKNRLFEVEIEDITSEGSGVCRIDGMAVFVPDTAIGDRAEIKIVKALKNYAYGIVERIVEPSPDRVSPDCPCYKKCGGCVFRHMSYEAELRVKDSIVGNAFSRIGGFDIVQDKFIGADETEGYRNKAQYPVAQIDGKAVCGFFAPRSHRLVPISDCALQPKVFSDILSLVMEEINASKLSGYDEATHTGLIRHIYIRRGARSGEIMLCFVVRKDVRRQLLPIAKKAAAEFPSIVSVVMNINPDRTNVILGKECVALLGNDYITDTMCGNIIQISPLAFYQVNTVQAERLYAKALEYAAPSPDDVIADLYCGAGTIGLSMAKKAGKIIGVEIVPEAVENAKLNASANGVENAEFYAGDAGRVFRELRDKGCAPDIIVVDPPRKGCSEETLDVIAQSSPRKIVMISCNPSTAARDSKLLSQRGYSLDRICGADLFPRTRHVECVVLLSRAETT